VRWSAPALLWVPGDAAELDIYNNLSYSEAGVGTDRLGGFSCWDRRSATAFRLTLLMSPDDTAAALRLVWVLEECRQMHIVEATEWRRRRATDPQIVAPCFRSRTARCRASAREYAPLASRG
jgi:hypothetical protein